MHLTRRIRIQLAIFTVVALVAGVDHGLRLHAAARTAVRRRPLHGDRRAARGRRPVRQRATSPTAAPKSAESTSVQPDRHRRRGRAVAELGHHDPVGPRRRGAQPVRGRRAVRRAAAAQRQRPAAEGRRRHPARPTPPCRPTSTRCWTPPTAVCRRSRATTSRRSIDEAYTAVGGLGPELSRLVKGRTALAIDARKNLDALTTLIDKSAAGPGLPDRHRRLDPGVGGAPGRPSPTSCRARTTPWPGFCTTVAPARRRGARSCSTGCSPPCRSCWPTWSASARWRSPTSPAIEQLLVLLPQGTAVTQATGVANREHQAGLQGRLPELQPEPQPAAAVHHRLPACPAAARARLRGLSRPPGRRSVLPGPAGLAVQRPRRPQPAVRDGAGQTGTRR